MFPKLFTAALLILLSSSCLAERSFAIAVVLDPHSFQGPEYANLQSVANNVAADVNRLIPGGPRDLTEQAPIICFQANASWNNDPSREAPITLVGPKLDGEPAETKGGTVRIVLNGITPADGSRLALQLSHELAHVKMGPTFDNELIETFATAVSLQVLHDLGFYGYLLRYEGEEVQTLPEDIQRSIGSRQLAPVRQFWQAHARWEQLSDRTLQTLGAMALIESGGLQWSALAGISQVVLRPGERIGRAFDIAPPDIRKLLRRPLGLDVLGYGPPHNKLPQ